MDDGLAQTLVHGEAVALPVRPETQGSELLVQHVAVSLAPLPEKLDELLAADVKPGPALLREALLQHVLRGDRRVVLAGQPHSVESAHLVEAREDVHRCVGGPVAHVRPARDVRGGHRDDERRLRAVRYGMEKSSRLPAFVPHRFDCGGIVFVEHRARGLCHAFSCSGVQPPALPSVHSLAKVSISTLPPLTMTPIRLPCSGSRRIMTAASTVAPAGSTMIFMRSATKRIAARISSSLTSRTPSARARTIGHVSTPGSVVRTPSAIVSGGSIATRSPRCHERCQSFPASGSTP